MFRTRVASRAASRAEFRRSRGTEGSNPSPSSGESAANLAFGDRSQNFGRCDNALQFATRKEAEANVRDLMMRWFAVSETRVVESDDPVNYRYTNGRLEGLTTEPARSAL